MYARESVTDRRQRSNKGCRALGVTSKRIILFNFELKLIRILGVRGTQQQQIVGQFESHVHDREELINILQPGMNDVVQQQQQPHQDTSQLHPVPRGPRSRSSGTRRRNVHNPHGEFFVPHNNYGPMDQGLLSLARRTEVAERAFTDPKGNALFSPNCWTFVWEG